MPSPAPAHNLYVFAHADGEQISGRAYFQGDIAARQADVIARDSDGRELGRTKTDDDGNFTLPVRSKVDHYLTAETTDGHASKPFTVPAAELSDELPAGSTTPAMSSPGTTTAAPPRGSAAEAPSELVSVNAELRVLQKQIESLRAQVDQSEHRLQLRDLLGGVGYILGLAGVGLYFKARMKHSKSAPGKSS